MLGRSSKLIVQFLSYSRASPLCSRSISASSLLTMANNCENPAKKMKTSYVHSRENFLAVYEKLRDDILEDKALGNQPPHSKDWLKQVLDYNVPGGKLNRGMAVYDVLEAIKGPEGISDSDAFKANVLGWCVEWLQAFFLVADDLMDGSITRRGQPCWYKQEKVGLIACNDYILIECCIYRIIKHSFAGHPAYVQIMDLFHEATFQTSHGQLLDLITAAPGGEVDLDKYTLDNYMRIVTYKTAYYSFYLPIACGMLLAGITDPAAYKVAEEILIEMGQYFQIQDDYFDCFADPKVIGKIGTDIEDNKCSWLICTALQHVGKEQREVIKANYGKHDPNSVAAVKAIFNELKLEEKFKAYEAESYQHLCARIEEQKALPKGVFTSLLQKIYKRSK